MSLRPTADFESGAGTPLILLHGATATWRAWKPVLAPLAERHRVWAPTLAGHHGGPSLLCAPMDVVTRIVDDVERRMDRATLERAHLVGNSLGGWVALELARRGRATSVVAFSPAGAWATHADLRALLRLFRIGALMSALPFASRLVAMDRTRGPLMRTVAQRGERIPRSDAADMFADIAACAILPRLLAGAEARGPIRPFAVPDGCRIRLAWASCDHTLPFARYGQPMIDSVRGAELVMLPGVGHVPMYDDPGLVVQTILEVSQAG